MPCQDRKQAPLSLPSWSILFIYKHRASDQSQIICHPQRKTKKRYTHSKKIMHINLGVQVLNFIIFVLILETPGSTHNSPQASRFGFFLRQGNRKVQASKKQSERARSGQWQPLQNNRRKWPLCFLLAIKSCHTLHGIPHRVGA